MAPKDKIAQAEALLAEAFAGLNEDLRHESSRARGALAQECWRLRLMTGDLRQYFSQSGQDWFIDQMLLKGRRDGVFVDIGGYDGVSGSNTLFFEIFRGWTGVLIEPATTAIEDARRIRRCHCVETAISGDGKSRDFLEVTGGFLQMSGRLDTYDAAQLKRLREYPDDLHP